MSVVALLCLVLLAGLTGLALVARTGLRQRPGRIAQYSAPVGMNLLAAGVLSGCEKRAVAAELVNLAVRGNVRFIAPDARQRQLRVELRRTTARR